MTHFILLLALWTNVNQTAVDGCENPEDSSWFFMACVPSPAECYYSCPPHRGYKAENDISICPIPGSDWACYCAEPSEV